MQVVGVSKVPPRRAPGIGEHTREILLELGFSEDKVEGLRADGSAPHGPQGVVSDAAHTPGKPI